MLHVDGIKLHISKTMLQFDNLFSCRNRSMLLDDALSNTSSSPGDTNHATDMVNKHTYLVLVPLDVKRSHCECDHGVFFSCRFKHRLENVLSAICLANNEITSDLPKKKKRMI